MEDNRENIRVTQRSDIKAGRPPDYAQTPCSKTDIIPTCAEDKNAAHDRIPPVELPAVDPHTRQPIIPRPL
eukprot:6603052-Pyramimonas_sp.AAC.1